ncbi:hypothetical protein SAMN06893096_1109 [Geodermatophilus pulveris]|uniref:Uncharacterized protein n=1 Tax=Geodermatophilus pulveris TaxID=1564159 RepID=A0A239I593_9ACTN|nr:hypothetical protein [Geodermatophilus pulveris]SNS89046.1 hypothetical protein SAMN06893096_1109 [Geodermatophilus pulveris]
MIPEPRATDLDLVDVETALLRAAVGDYAAEAAVLLLVNAGHWPAQLQQAGLVSLLGDVDGEGMWAQVAWPDVDAALRAGTIGGSGSQLRVLRAAASLADGQPVDLGDLAAGLDRDHLALVLAAVAHAGGSHGEDLPPLAAWPAR